MIKFSFSYWFWIAITVAAMVEMWASLYKSFTDFRQDYHDMWCLGTILCAGAFIWCLHIANEYKEKKDE